MADWRTKAQARLEDKGGPSDKVLCPDCDAPMILRKSTRGSFHGCSRFPSCRGTRKVGEETKFVPAAGAGYEPMVKMSGSDEQEAIWDYLAKGKSNIIVDSGPGVGKTFVAVQWCLRAPKTQQITIVAFNRHIAKEANGKLAASKVPNARARTYHSLGYGILREHYKNLGDPDEKKMQNIFEGLCPAPLFGKGQWRMKLNLAEKLAGFVKNYLIDYHAANFRDEMERLADRHSLDFNGEFNEAVSMVPEALDKCKQLVASKIDFDDMAYLPIVLNLKPRWKPDLMITDECLVGYTPILLDEKGNWKEIRDLVESKYDGTVLSFDVKTGTSCQRKVIGWHKIPLQKKVVQICTRRVGFLASGAKTKRSLNHVKFFKRYLICTEDHKIFSNGKWVSAGKLKPGDRLTEESCAPRLLSYQSRARINQNGRQNLSKNLSKRNEEKLCGWKNCGNGHGPSASEAGLLKALGKGWVWNYKVQTHCLRKKGSLPTFYKIDLAFPSENIAVEVDGSTHRSARAWERDRRKERFLASLGWSTIRIKNEEVKTLTKELLHQKIFNSPSPSEVISVNPLNVKEDFVYDITVEGTHNYYADGIVVHNCQDLGPIQHELMFHIGASRLMAVGDKRQAIYAWRGAASDSMEIIEQRLQNSPLGVKIFPLTITRRCPKSHVALAQNLFPNIQALPDAPDGEILSIKKKKAVEMMAVGDLVICRVNAELIGVAYALIRRKIRPVIKGRDIGKGLRQLINKLEERAVERLDANARATYSDELAVIREELGIYGREEAERLLKLEEKGEGRMQNLMDKCACMMEFIANAKTVQQIRENLEALFKDDDEANAVVLGTVHRCKGLEAERVFILAPELIPHPMARKQWEKDSEKNLAWVASTRAKFNAKTEAVGTLIFCGPIPAIFEGVPAASPIEPELLRQEVKHNPDFPLHGSDCDCPDCYDLHDQVQEDDQCSK